MTAPRSQVQRVHVLRTHVQRIHVLRLHLLRSRAQPIHVLRLHVLATAPSTARDVVIVRQHSCRTAPQHEAR